jgi:hypothetical protein
MRPIVPQGDGLDNNDNLTTYLRQAGAKQTTITTTTTIFHENHIQPH